MTIKEYQKKLDKRLNEVQLSNSLIKNCITDIHDKYVNRIFINGRRSNLTKIGNYSESYKKVRRKKGRQVATVNFVFGGRLFSNVANSLQRKGKSWVNGATTKFEADKVDWMIERFGKDVWQIAKTELRTLGNCVSKASLKIMTK